MGDGQWSVVSGRLSPDGCLLPQDFGLRTLDLGPWAARRLGARSIAIPIAIGFSSLTSCSAQRYRFRYLKVVSLRENGGAGMAAGKHLAFEPYGPRGIIGSRRAVAFSEGGAPGRRSTVGALRSSGQKVTRVGTSPHANASGGGTLRESVGSTTPPSPTRYNEAGRRIRIRRAALPVLPGNVPFDVPFDSIEP